MYSEVAIRLRELASFVDVFARWLHSCLVASCCSQIRKGGFKWENAIEKWGIFPICLSHSRQWSQRRARSPPIFRGVEPAVLHMNQVMEIRNEGTGSPFLYPGSLSTSAKCQRCQRKVGCELCSPFSPEALQDFFFKKIPTWTCLLLVNTPSLLSGLHTFWRGCCMFHRGRMGSSESWPKSSLQGSHAGDLWQRGLSG